MTNAIEGFRRIFLIHAVLVLAAVRLHAAPAPSPGVTVSQTPAAYTLGNDILVASIDKNTGNLISLQCNGAEFLKTDVRHPGGYWSHAPAGAGVVDSITIDP